MGCRTMENFLPLIYGGAKRRSGTQYVATQNDSDAVARVVGFEHSVDDTYVLLFENQGIRMYTGGSTPARVTRTATDITDLDGDGSTATATSTDHGLLVGDIVIVAGTTSYDGEHEILTVADDNTFTFATTKSTTNETGTASWGGIATPYLTADLFQLDIKQSADVMFIAHGDYEPRKLSRTGDTNWTLETLSIQDGPFRTQNDDTTSTIAASATTGSVTLTATKDIFATGTTAGHAPSGSVTTSKATTGSLFQILHSVDKDTGDQDLTGATQQTTDMLVYKGSDWDFTTQGTWTGTVKLQRSYDNKTTWETVVTVTSADNKNVVTDGSEEHADAYYRAYMTSYTSGTCTARFAVRNPDNIGIVQITAVTNSKSATATVLSTLGETTATSRWSEGSWSNYRGWPKTVDISAEERLTFGGSSSRPLTIWGSVIGDFTSFKAGVLDNDAIIFTLVGTGQQNTISWMAPKAALMIGTIGGEHALGATDDKEALTPTNVQARLQATYGSSNPQANIVNNAILFLQRGNRKIRELIYSFEDDSYNADDLNTFAEHITKSGITDMAFQRNPNPMLYCVRNDGQMAVMAYERSQQVNAWARYVTNGEFESVCVIYGGSGEEDEVWVTAKRVIEGSTVRYLERFANQEYDFIDETMMVDSATVVESSYDAQNIDYISYELSWDEGDFNEGVWH